jgi:DHA1 family bicyclomycin/chloramphenicol resistance-like MFS transporter
VQAQRVMSTITMTFALGPALAPVIGGWVHVWFGWRAVFGTMALLGTSLMLLAAWRLPETHPPEKRSHLHLGVLVGNVVHVMADRRFQWNVASSVLCFVSLHAYIGSAPAIVLDHWHLTETQFAMLTVPIIGGYSIGAWISGKAAGFIEPDRLMRWGYHGCLAATTAMLALQYAWPGSPILLQQAILVCIAGSIQCIFPIVTLRILDLFPAIRGAASSAQSFCAMVMSALMMGVVAPWLSITMQRLALYCFGLTLTGWLIWMVKLRRPPDRADHTY